MLNNYIVDLLWLLHRVKSEAWNCEIAGCSHPSFLHVELICLCRHSVLNLALENSAYRLSRKLILGFLSILSWFWCDYHYPNHYYYPSLSSQNSRTYYLQAGHVLIVLTIFIAIITKKNWQSEGLVLFGLKRLGTFYNGCLHIYNDVLMALTHQKWRVL